ncbi:MAG: hypothetical protein JWM11_1497 [Planctomycetaceae bacterium]|nr:hypothetical protein [Planctomycetaceae bacterium]
MSLASYRAAPPRDADNSGTRRGVEVTLVTFPDTIGKVLSGLEKPVRSSNKSRQHIDFRHGVRVAWQTCKG